MYYRILIFSFLFFFSLGSSHEISAQNAVIDSLQILIKQDKADTNKVNHLHVLCWHYGNLGQYDTAIYYGNLELALAQRLNFKTGMTAAYTNIGLTYYNKGEFYKLKC